MPKRAKLYPDHLSSRLFWITRGEYVLKSNYPDYLSDGLERWFQFVCLVDSNTYGHPNSIDFNETQVRTKSCHLCNYKFEDSASSYGISMQWREIRLTQWPKKKHSNHSLDRRADFLFLKGVLCPQTIDYLRR